MGFLSNLFSHSWPKVPTIMPPGAVQDILSGKLPSISTSRIILRKGEQCCYIDKAILLETKEEKMYVRSGTSMPGIFKGTRYNWGTSRPRTYEKTVQHQAILYVTTQRIILQCKGHGFDKSIRDISAIEPYSNAFEFQFGGKTYTILIPDGTVLDSVIKLVS